MVAYLPVEDDLDEVETPDTTCCECGMDLDPEDTDPYTGSCHEVHGSDTKRICRGCSAEAAYLDRDDRDR